MMKQQQPMTKQLNLTQWVQRLGTIKVVTLYNLNKPDEAIRAYDKVIEIDPKNPDAWYDKGLFQQN